MSKLLIKSISFNNFWLIMPYLFIRFKVFILESKRTLLQEFAKNDITSNHYIFLLNGNAIGVARIIYRENIAELGRVAVLKEYRNHGYGKEIILNMINHIKDENKAKNMRLFVEHRSLTNFYGQFGFIENGEVYFDNLPYLSMIMPI